MAPSRTLLTTSPSTTVGYSLLLTSDPGLVLAAQQLRHRVLTTEFGPDACDGPDGIDTDRFDPHCEHLVVRDDGSGEIVGTYRLLPPSGARAAGGLYADGEFDLGALGPLRHDLVETGRSCVAPAHRNGAVVGLVWAGIGHYLRLRGHRWVIGCASVSLADGGASAAATWRRVQDSHLAPEAFRASPHRPWEPADATGPVPRLPVPRLPIPPLLRGYLRLGAWVCGPPAHDPDFDCADFPVLLGLDHMEPRYARHFLGADPAPAAAPADAGATVAVGRLVGGQGR